MKYRIYKGIAFVATLFACGMGASSAMATTTPAIIGVVADTIPAQHGTLNTEGQEPERSGHYSRYLQTPGLG